MSDLLHLPNSESMVLSTDGWVVLDKSLIGEVRVPISWRDMKTSELHHHDQDKTNPNGLLRHNQHREPVAIVGFPDWCERARCTARAIPLLGFFFAVLTSLHSRYVCSILIAFIHYIGSLASCSTPFVCLTSSPRPNDILSICLSSSSSVRSRRLFHQQSTRIRGDDVVHYAWPF